MTTPYASCDNLGCCNDTVVMLTDRCGSPTLEVLENVVELSYGRILDDVSEARVVVAVPGALPDCCGALGDVRTWCHEVHVFRCGARVWSGPVQRVVWFSDRIEIIARDNLAWLKRTVVKAEFEAVDQDLSAIAAAVIRANLSGDDAAGCLTLDVQPTGIVLEDYFVDFFSGYVYDVLTALGELGLHWTALGSRLLLFGAEPLSLLGPLTDQDFTEQLAVVEDGAFAATSVFVVGNGVEASASVTGVCGVVEALRRDDVLEEEADVQLQARRLVAGGYPTPLQVEVPSGASLAPEAPICVPDMVPGVDVRVFSNGTCRPAAADLRLTDVTVEWSDGQEDVRISLAPASLEGGGFEELA